MTVSLESHEPNIYSPGFRIYITITACMADVRMCEEGDPYVTESSASSEPVDNSRPTAYDYCDDRYPYATPIYERVVRSRRHGPKPATE